MLILRQDVCQKSEYRHVFTLQVALTGILDELAELGKPCYHMLGNHCLYNLERELLHQKMALPNLPGDGSSYYSFEPHSSWRFIVLDAYDGELFAWCYTLSSRVNWRLI